MNTYIKEMKRVSVYEMKPPYKNFRDVSETDEYPSIEMSESEYEMLSSLEASVSNIDYFANAEARMALDIVRKLMSQK